MHKFLTTSSYVSSFHSLCQKTRKKTPGTIRSEPRASVRTGRIPCTHPPESPYGKHSDEREGKHHNPTPRARTSSSCGSYPLSLAGRQVPASPAGGLGPAKSKTQTKTQTNHTEETPTRIRTVTRMVCDNCGSETHQEVCAAQSIARCARRKDIDRSLAHARSASVANARQSDIQHANVDH